MLLIPKIILIPSFSELLFVFIPFLFGFLFGILVTKVFLKN